MALITRTYEQYLSEEDNELLQDSIDLDWKQLQREVFEEIVEKLDSLGVDVIRWDTESSDYVFKFVRRVQD